MLRFVPAAVALVGLLAAVQPSFADPSAAITSGRTDASARVTAGPGIVDPLTSADHAQEAASARAQPASPAPVSSASSNATAPAAPWPEKNTSPVGFGWG